MSDPIDGNFYTVRCALAVNICKDACLTGDVRGNTATPTKREITNGTRLVHHHYDPLTGYAYMTTPTGEAVRVPVSYLIPWE